MTRMSRHDAERQLRDYYGTDAADRGRPARETDVARAPRPVRSSADTSSSDGVKQPRRSRKS